MQPLLNRRRSLNAGNQPLLQQRRSLIPGKELCFHRTMSLDLAKEATKKLSCEGNTQNTAEPHGRENCRVRVMDINEQTTATANVTESTSDKSFNFENGKLNALQSEGSCRKLPVFYQRPPSTVIEEAIVEADEVENFTVPVQSETTSPSLNVVEIPSKKEEGRILARKSTCTLVMRPPSSLGTKQLDSSNITEKGIERNSLRQETLGNKETTSSRLRKQSSRDTAIGLLSNEKNKRFRKIGLVQENFC